MKSFNANFRNWLQCEKYLGVDSSKMQTKSNYYCLQVACQKTQTMFVGVAAIRYQHNMWC